MSVVVDTSAWIEWALKSPVATTLAPICPPREKCIVPTLVQHELAKWTCLALLAAELGRQYRLASADSIIYATARDLGADLLTCDAHFSGLPGVTYVASRT